MADEIRVPTKEVLADLPRWAVVVYAIRNTMRIRALCGDIAGNELSVELQRLDNAIDTCRSIAKSHHDDYDTYISILRAMTVRISHFPDRSKLAGSVLNRLLKTTMASVRASANFENARRTDVPEKYREAMRIGKAAHQQVLTYADATCDTLMREAFRAAQAQGLDADAADREAGLAAASDYEVLASLAVQEEWTNDSGVDISLLGPLWPDGEPEWWSGESTQDQQAPPERMKLTAIVGEYAPVDEVVTELVNLYQAVDRMHRANGGAGLTIEDWDIMVESYEGMGVPS